MENIRIGFIGAGAIARDRHLPGLKKLPGVELVAVANRTLESSQRVAQAWGFAEAMADWAALIRRPDIDAVFIGTWPYRHRDMSIAALEAGKHVFCQARMAMDLAEAQAMVDAADAHPSLVNMICPPPMRMPFEPYIQGLLARGELGPLVSVELTSISDASLQSDTLHWREDVRYSGIQIMAVGIFAETLNAWVGPYDWLTALCDTPVTQKKDDDGRPVITKIPQVVHIQGRLAQKQETTGDASKDASEGASGGISGGASGGDSGGSGGGVPVWEYHCGVAADRDSHGHEILIRGLKGTLRYRFGDVLELAKPGQPFEAVQVPADQQRGWQVEQDFIDAVRLARAGKSWRVSPDFNEGLLYMRKMQAIDVSARTGRPVRLSDLSA